MATDTSSVNGIYEGQYAQPAELAASTPSHAPSASQSSSTVATQQKADPQEIGWYFVEQYYTTLSKSPDRIHLFYSKKSQLVTGQEAEKVLPAVGTKAISEKIKSLDIQDCKVRVLNVDSQSSFDNIVVQVIGQMSNNSEPHHKFVQTFILATQPNGYFVLNDIFRFLNDEEDEIIEDEPVQDEIPTEQPTQQAEVPAEITTAPETVTTQEAIEKVDEKLEEEQEHTSTVEESTNGVEESVTDEPEASEVSDAKDLTSDVLEDPDTEQPAEPTHTPVDAAPKAEAASEGPPARKTWANMVGTKAPAIPALPQSSSAAPAATAAAITPVTSTTASASTSTQSKAQKSAQPPQAPKSSTQSTSDNDSANAQSNGWQTAEHSKKARSQQAKAPEGTVYAYIKNVNERVDARILREVLEKFGDIKYYDVSRPKQSAFVEFVDPAGFAAAVAANPHTVGTEQIVVEERRGRNGPYTPNATFSRGGAAPNRGRGGLQQRSGSQGNNYPRENARGGFQQRGGKPGNVTPKGRGQAQPAQ